MSVLNINQLSKNYGRTRALQDLSLTVEAGQVFGILGPNGSGKTTTLGIVLGVLRETSGDYSWFDGEKPHLARRRIGSLLETPNFYPYLSATNNLKITARIRRVAPSGIPEILRLVGLAERAGDPYGTYSLGMKQRLAIAATLLGDPDVLIFDEPTNGIDAHGIVEIRNLIKAIAGRGKTIVLASHILDEVEKVCSHVAVLQQGQLITSGSIASVLQKDKITVEFAATDLPNLQKQLQAQSGVTEVSIVGDQVLATIEQKLDLAELNSKLMEQGVKLSHLSIQKTSLEARFLELTGGAL